MSDNIDDFRQVLQSSKKILVLSGAGLSAASGIPTYRGGTGSLWRKYDPASLATPAAFSENQSRVWQFHHYRRELVLKATPNPGHYVLTRLAIPSMRHKIAPHAELTHVTQNVDGLLTKALAEVQAPLAARETPAELIEMHGRLFDVRCTAHDCSYLETNYHSPICPALGSTESFADDRSSEPVVKRADLPRCPLCGQMCRPGVVWFGERPHRILDILALADQADLCIIVGSSSAVQPASKLGSRVKAHGGKVAVFNLEPSNHAEDADFLFLGPCERRLEEVFAI